jgi:hypothetical protein
VPKTWGVPPYSALAAELIFCNKGPNKCGGLSQGARSRFIAGTATVYRGRENRLSPA